MRAPWIALAALLAGCATAPAPKPISIVSGPLPANAEVVGQSRGFNLDDLKDQARARGGDAITTPTTVSMRNLLQSDVIRYRR